MRYKTPTWYPPMRFRENPNWAAATATVPSTRRRRKMGHEDTSTAGIQEAPGMSTRKKSGSFLKKRTTKPLFLTCTLQDRAATAT